MRSPRFSTVFYSGIFPVSLSPRSSRRGPAGPPWRTPPSSACSGSRRGSPDTTPRPRCNRRIIESARAGALFSMPRQKPGPLWYPYETGSEISPRNLARYEEICSQLACSHLLMGRIYPVKDVVLIEIRLYSTVEKRILCALTDTLAPGALKKTAGQTAQRVSLYLRGRLPAISDLRISRGSSLSEISLSWKCTGSNNNFIISRSPYEAGPFGKIGETRSTRFIDTTAEQGLKFWYTVAVTREGPAGIPASGAGYRKSPGPQGLTVSEMLDNRTRPWPEPGTHDEQEKESLHLELFEKYYESPSWSLSS